MTSCQVYIYLQSRLRIDTVLSRLSDVPSHGASVKLSKNNPHHTTTSLKFMAQSLFRLEEREFNVTIRFLVSFGSAGSPFWTKFDEDRHCNVGYRDK